MSSLPLSLDQKPEDAEASGPVEVGWLDARRRPGRENRGSGTAGAGPSDSKKVQAPETRYSQSSIQKGAPGYSDLGDPATPIRLDLDRHIKPGAVPDRIDLKQGAIPPGVPDDGIKDRAQGRDLNFEITHRRFSSRGDEQLDCLLLPKGTVPLPVGSPGRALLCLELDDQLLALPAESGARCQGGLRAVDTRHEGPQSSFRVWTELHHGTSKKVHSHGPGGMGQISAGLPLNSAVKIWSKSSGRTPPYQ